MTALAPDRDTRLSRVTPMEQACLRLVARRLSSKEIAAELGIAKTSVDTYCNRARSKLGVTDRYEAARLLLAEQGVDPVDIVVGAAAAPHELPLPQPARPRRRLVVGVAVATLLVLAVGTLLAGLRAIEDMKPPVVAAKMAQMKATER